MRDAEPDAGLAEAVRLQRDLYLLWRIARDAGGLALTPRGLLTRQSLRRVAARLAAPDSPAAPTADGPETADRRLHFVRRLLERLRLLRLSDDERTLVAAEPGEMERYVALPLEERLRLALRLWVAGGWWPEVIAPSARPPRILTPAPPRIALARRRLLDMLREAAPVATLALPPAAPPLPRRGAARSPAPSRAGRPMAGRAPADKTATAETYAALHGPLSWLGLVVAQSQAADAFIVGGAAAALAEGGEPLHLPERHGKVALLPNLTVIVFPPLTAPALCLLDACADEVTVQQAATYRLTRAAAARARRAGMGDQQIAARLESLAGSPLPANVRTTLGDWQRQAARLRFTGPVDVLLLRDAALLDALLADPRSADWVERRLAPMAAVLAPGALAAVRAWLLRRGEPPAVTPA